MVRLLRYFDIDEKTPFSTLHSTMVRLLQYSIDNISFIPAVFTFHYGQIATYPAPSHPSTLINLYIPLWSDCYMVNRNMGWNMLWLYIPLWSDCYFVMILMYIRQWDFTFHYGQIATCYLCRKFRNICYFTFHYGQIATYSSCKPVPKSSFFTFHYGQIATGQRNRQIRTKHYFTFHYGQIATCMSGQKALKHQSLHSTMVRLLLQPAPFSAAAYQLYIPLWSDCYRS